MPDVHATCTPVGVRDLAGLLTMNIRTVRRWLYSHLLPEPQGPELPGRWTVDGALAWCWEHDIAPWLRTGHVVPTDGRARENTLGLSKETGPG